MIQTSEAQPATLLPQTNLRTMMKIRATIENKKDKIISQMQENDVVNAYALYYLPINFYKT